jgi:hypothetical protein
MEFTVTEKGKVKARMEDGGTLQAQSVEVLLLHSMLAKLEEILQLLKGGKG